MPLTSELEEDHRRPPVVLCGQAERPSSVMQGYKVGSCTRPVWLSERRSGPACEFVSGQDRNGV